MTALDQAPSVLWKAFDVLDAFSHGRRVLTLSEIARRSGLPKSTVHRLLPMLMRVGAVEQAPGGYTVGVRMFSVGSMSAEVALREVALPRLERLRRVTRQTVHLAVLRDGESVYLEKLPSLVSPDTPALVGGRLPAHRTGVGKVLLTFGDGHVADPALAARLARVRRDGFATDREEATAGLACLAVPIMVGGRAAAAVSVAFAAGQGDGVVFLGPLRETAVAISRAAAVLPSFAP
ncbi:IclR family transcriptional regulator [Streptomyces zinciresistens K42]|uniref:Glycerol operon regulatory protein n=1 Tax=Streptomyces zinciresistens K42 TaxID=700597 RepID=G2GM66_9ACTN|nr:IclR family transcriptional regulator [Streptomyces zinciresistens]EGX55389.1 IclR family transcriptional regulator [Streptomyces zinciresistens K42]